MLALRRLSALLILTTAIVGALPALTVEELETIISAAVATESGSMALDVEREGRGAVTVQLDSGRELYVRVSDRRVVDRERGILNGEERRVLREIENGASYLSLPEAYSSALDSMAQADETENFGADDFESIGYGRERGRSVIEISFVKEDWGLELYLDPETGEMLFYDWDE